MSIVSPITIRFAGDYTARVQYRHIFGESDEPVGISIPFGRLPSDTFIAGRRYQVMFDRLAPPAVAAAPVPPATEMEQLEDGLRDFEAMQELVRPSVTVRQEFQAMERPVRNLREVFPQVSGEVQQQMLRNGVEIGPPMLGVNLIVTEPADRVRGIRADMTMLDDSQDINPEFYAAVLGEPYQRPLAYPYNIVVAQHGHRIELSWRCDDSEAQFFLIERAIDDSDWQRQATVAAQPGLNTWHDPAAGVGMHCYRVTPMQSPIDDGRYEIRDISNILTVRETIINRWHYAWFASIGPFRATFRAWMRIYGDSRLVDFARQQFREHGFYRRIMPPSPMLNDELDRSMPTDRPLLVPDP